MNPAALGGAKRNCVLILLIFCHAIYFWALEGHCSYVLPRAVWQASSSSMVTSQVTLRGLLSLSSNPADATSCRIYLTASSSYGPTACCYWDCSLVQHDYRSWERVLLGCERRMCHGPLVLKDV
eukprot:7830001-Ditylum_brightwellii.AAC.1